MNKLLIITTGGTIDKIYFDDMSDYQIGDPQIGQNVLLPFIADKKVMFEIGTIMNMQIIETETRNGELPLCRDYLQSLQMDKIYCVHDYWPI